MKLFNSKEDERFVEVYNDIFSYPTIHDVAEELNYNARTVRKKAQKLRSQGVELVDRSNQAAMIEILQNPEEYQEYFDGELLSKNVRLAKEKQKQQDKNRIDNKTFRHDARLENAIEEHSREIVEILREKNFSVYTKFHNNLSKRVGIVHISDPHLNERVDLEHNTYDWNVASKRLKKYADSIRPIAHAYGISKIVVAFGGDLLNSDRRLDELLANAGNRAKGCVLAVDLLSQFLMDLNQDFDLTVTSVIGNESRIPQDVGWQHEVASDNYDFTIFEMLKLHMESDGIQFVRPIHPTETVIEVNGQNVLLIHGNGSVKKNNIDQQIQQIKGRYLAQGIHIDFVIFGHIHNSYVSETFARSGSLVGPNDYSHANLNLEGRASQNFYMVHDGGGFDGLKVDVHDVEDIQGYEIDSRLEAYNTQGVERRQETTIHKVVI